ncbi:hypothetical protein [Peribacillus frigoritolerans]|uniref:hypothetical protein n=1 Tax=Peribacillus frigoritolerans TaxID=450367 RepID=UPI0020798187|nr:hypothetical protein [Peribacillus frigoritolerans]USK66295.1 hypothetical protein LIT26_06600 [Peribacillus frigoritolerans]
MEKECEGMMQAYLIGTAIQWVSLVAILVWIGLGIYQFTEIRMRKKTLNDYRKLFLNDKE